jgi:hypothetical protein
VPGTRLHLHFRSRRGPWERLIDGEADLILHRVDKSDPRVEWMTCARCLHAGGGARVSAGAGLPRADHARADARVHAVRDPRHRAPFTAAATTS